VEQVYTGYREKITVPGTTQRKELVKKKSIGEMTNKTSKKHYSRRSRNTKELFNITYKILSETNRGSLGPSL
jgi:hypothetical protein